MLRGWRGEEKKECFQVQVHETRNKCWTRLVNVQSEE